MLGLADDATEGNAVGALDGACDSSADGATDGITDGSNVGTSVERADCDEDGAVVGTVVCLADGRGVD